MREKSEGLSIYKVKNGRAEFIVLACGSEDAKTKAGQLPGFDANEPCRAVRARLDAKLEAELEALNTKRQKAKSNPGPVRGLYSAWKKWTGAAPGQTFKLTLEDLEDCPSEVVMLGRLSKLITSKGKIEVFQKGPFLVSDAGLKKVWLVDHEPRSFDLDLKGGLIGYLAKKPKFGDAEAVEYVHAFVGRARAEMDGQVGHLTGQFRLTEAGIEG